MSTTLLRIEASPRGARSHSRHLTRDYTEAWQKAHPEGRVDVLDLGAAAPPLVTEGWVEGAFTPAEGHSPAAKEAIAVSDRYVDQLLAADEIVIGTPIYNFGAPAVLKAWIDQVSRAGRTFSAGPDGYKGLVVGKKARVLVASGGDMRPGSAYWGYNFLEPHLRAVLGFLGITDVQFVYAANLNGGDEARTQGLQEAREAALQLAA